MRSLFEGSAARVGLESITPANSTMAKSNTRAALRPGCLKARVVARSQLRHGGLRRPDWHSQNVAPALFIDFYIPIMP